MLKIVTPVTFLLIEVCITIIPCKGKSFPLKSLSVVSADSLKRQQQDSVIRNITLDEVVVKQLNHFYDSLLILSDF